MRIDCFTSAASTTIFWNLLSRAPSFSTILVNSSIVVAPMHWISPLARAGLSIFAASRLPWPPPAPTMVWNSSMKSMMSGSALTVFMMSFTLFSKSPRYLVPATTEAMSRDMMRFLARTGDIEPSAILRAMPSTIADLPTPGSPMSIGLFFFRRPRISITLDISLSLPTTGSSFPSVAALVRSVPNSVMSAPFSLCVSSELSCISSPSSLVSPPLGRSPFLSI